MLVLVRVNDVKPDAQGQVVVEFYSDASFDSCSSCFLRCFGTNLPHLFNTCDFYGHERRLCCETNVIVPVQSSPEADYGLPWVQRRFQGFGLVSEHFQM